MGERRALVIASQCEGLNLLSFLPDAASDVAGALLDPTIGGCVPALPGRGLLVDPTVDELDDAITEAFARASEDEATLFVALVGHGEYTADDFYFLTRDTKLPPSSRTAFMLAQRVKELLGQYSMLDGLVLLLDTCHAGIAAKQAAGRWLDIVSKAGRRFEVLTASDDRTAANGCFSRQLVQVLRSGHPKLGERLRCPDMKAVLSTLCPMQTAVHLAYDGRHFIEAGGDEGLWLAMNTSEAWRSSPAAGNPAAAEIDRLTRDYKPTQELATLVSNMLAGTNYVAVVGMAGTGKSKLIAALARPSVAERIVPPKLMDAVLFLSATDTPERVAAELARQLGKNVPWFADAAVSYQNSASPSAWQAADAFERAVLGPVKHKKEKVRIAVDGIDNVPFRDRLLRLLEDHSLTGTLQLVLTSRRSLQATRTIRTDWSLESITDVGNLRSPFGTLPSTSPGGVTSQPAADPILDILDAAGKAQLPTTVLAAATGRSVRSVRDFIVAHPTHITRRNPGTPTETVTRTTDGPPATPAAHLAIATALATLAPINARTSATPEQLYADAAEPEHLWQSGRKTEALQSLTDRGPAIPAEIRDLWDHWSRRVTTSEGPESPLAVTAQSRYLTALAKTGDLTKALTGFQSLLPVAVEVLGPADREIAKIRNNICYLLFELANFEESARELRALVADTASTFGADDEETLHAQHLYAVVVGKLGNGGESARLSHQMIPHAEAALGPHHEVTVNARLNFSFYTLADPDPSAEVLANRQHLADLVAELDHDDPRTVEIGVVVHWDDPEQLKSLADRSIRLHNRHDHPDVLKIRERLRELGD